MGKELAFFEGKIIPIGNAKVGIMTHALHYGTAVFEGIRGNWNPNKNKMYIFRLKEHYERLLKGCKILNIDINYSVEELCDITVNLIKESGYKEDIYIRPLAYKSDEKVANLKLHELASNFALMIVPFGNDALADNPVADTHGVGHLNPDFVRFEELDLHVVHAQLKPGQRHLYESRTFYFLDGQPGLLVYQDMYDGNQELMRTYMQTHVVGGNNGNGLTNESMCTVQGEFTFDFATRTYSGGSIMGPAITPSATTYNGEEKPVSFYTPDGLRRYAR